MKFNSGRNSIVADIDRWAGTDRTTYSIDDIVDNANTALDEITADILANDNSWESDDSNATDLFIGFKTLVSGQADYTLSVTHLKISKVRVKDPNGNWVTLTPSSRRNWTDSEIAATGTPSKYDKFGSSLLLNSTPNYGSASGIEITFQRALDYFTTASTTTVPGFASPFHRLVSLKTALDYTDQGEMESRSNKIEKRIAKLEKKLERFYQDRDFDRPQNLGVQKEDYGQTSDDYIM